MCRGWLPSRTFLLIEVCLRFADCLPILNLPAVSAPKQRFRDPRLNLSRGGAGTVASGLAACLRDQQSIPPQSAREKHRNDRTGEQSKR